MKLRFSRRTPAPCRLAILALSLAAASAQSLPPLRPPSVPLVACDPYFSLWSPGDKLTDVDTTHWTGKTQRLGGQVVIDGKPFRFLGSERTVNAPALPQTALEVLPTRTIYSFAGEGISLKLTFMTPALADDLEVLARPVTYVTFDAASTDQQTHQVQVSFTASGELAVNLPDQLGAVARVEGVSGLTVLRAGSTDQSVLAKRGDDIRIDWGYLYLAAPQSMVKAALAGTVPGQTSPGGQDAATGQAAGSLALALTLDLGPVSTQPASRWLMLAYDDLYSIQYMKQNLRPYWRRNGWEGADLLKASAAEYDSLRRRCEAFDGEFMADLRKAGGEHYARIGALAYRQCFAAGKFVADAQGKPLQFCKENHSNGCISTSDVFYPMAPQFLLFGPTLTKAFMVPFMNYAASERWKFPFAPHDLGQYPHANGQRYGGGERTEENQMPVEESGNLLLLFGAVAQMEGNANFAGLYWPQLTKWALYLKEKGYDPENQLCTDDFAGHLAHNVNLSVKAICALGAYGKLCALRGDQATADEYLKLAKDCATRWTKEADDGEKYRLAFDKPNTWSQKYNLVWDRILGLGLFSDEVRAKEMAYYRKIQNPYGLPLDNRKEYTKLDWTLWTATLTQNREDFEALVAPVDHFIQETPDRSPLTDWYQTKTAKKVGFTARPVIGGVFIQMLYDRAVWGKYAGRDRTKASGWAPMPKAPVVRTVLPTARESAATWRYTTEQPADGWFKPDFDASAWKEGQGGFGTRRTPGATIRTEWSSADIWLRREFSLPAGKTEGLQLSLHHDDDAEAYLNGTLVTKTKGYLTDYTSIPLTGAALAGVKETGNVLAIHCHQISGGQYIDAGLVQEQPPGQP